MAALRLSLVAHCLNLNLSVRLGLDPPHLTVFWRSRSRVEGIYPQSSSGGHHRDLESINSNSSFSRRRVPRRFVQQQHRTGGIMVLPPDREAAPAARNTTRPAERTTAPERELGQSPARSPPFKCHGRGVLFRGCGAAGPSGGTPEEVFGPTCRINELFPHQATA